MPIAIQCLSCSARLNVADTTAGKRVKCPKCQTVVEVPVVEEDSGFEVVEPAKPAPAIARAMKPKPAAIDDDEDEKPRPKKRVSRDDDDDDDEPRSKKKSSRYDDDDDDDRPRKKKKPASSFGIDTKLIGGVLGFILVVVIIGLKIAGAIAHERRLSNNWNAAQGPQNVNTNAGQATNSKTWQDFQVPTMPVTLSTPVALKNSKHLIPGAAADPTLVPYSAILGNTEYIVMAVKLDPPLPFGQQITDELLDLMLTEFGKASGFGQPTRRSSARLAGENAKQAVFQGNKSGILRLTVIQGKLFMLAVFSTNGAPIDENHQDAMQFFNSARQS
jgi:phage FluMu protein Com